MIAGRLLLALWVASGSACSDELVEMPATPATCGGGAEGELNGSVRTSDGPLMLTGVAPAWKPGGSDSPGIIVIAPEQPGLILYAWAGPTYKPPLVGEQPKDRLAYVRHGAYIRGALRLIIDESEASTPVCLAGRFEADFAETVEGRLAGWFRTR